MQIYVRTVNIHKYGKMIFCLSQGEMSHIHLHIHLTYHLSPLSVPKNHDKIDHLRETLSSVQHRRFPFLGKLRATSGVFLKSSY